MANTVIAVRSSGTAAATPSLGVIANGEIALNFADGIIYYKTSSNTLGSIRTTQPAGLTTEVQFNDAGSFGGDSGFTYNKTANTLTIDNVSVTNNLFPSVDNTGLVGNSAFTWSNGQFTNLTVDSTLTVTSTLNVRAAIDLADNDILRFGAGDDWEMFHDGTTNRIDLTTGNLVIRDDGTVGDPTIFTFERLTGNFTANGNVTATNIVSTNAVVFQDNTRQTTAGATVGDILALAIALG